MEGSAVQSLISIEQNTAIGIAGTAHQIGRRTVSRFEPLSCAVGVIEFADDHLGIGQCFLRSDQSFEIAAVTNHSVINFAIQH